MTNGQQIEGHGLRLSVWGAAFMAVLGIGFYFPTHSQAVLLDGLFSLIGFFVSLLTVKVSRVVLQPDDDTFQFGYGTFEPMLNLVKGLLTVGVCVFALVLGVLALFEGGRPLQSGPAVIYAVIAAAGCFAIAGSQRRRLRGMNSPLLSVDMRQWIMDGAISSVVAIAFLGGAVLQRGRFADWVDYLDPVLVILLVVVMIRMPIGIITSNLWELLLAAPPPEEQERVAGRLRHILEEKGLSTYRTRMAKAGRSYFLVLHVRVPDEGGPATVEDFDKLRATLHAAVQTDGSPYSLDVVFTREERWME